MGLVLSARFREEELEALSEKEQARLIKNQIYRDTMSKGEYFWKKVKRAAAESKLGDKKRMPSAPVAAGMKESNNTRD